MNPYLIYSLIINGHRPIIDPFVPGNYRDLINRCWSQDWKDRPSFEEIVDQLRHDESFTDDLIDKEDFYDYVSYIDSLETNFDPNKFLSRKSKTFEIFLKKKKK